MQNVVNLCLYTLILLALNKGEPVKKQIGVVICIMYTILENAGLTTLSKNLGLE